MEYVEIEAADGGLWDNRRTAVLSRSAHKLDTTVGTFRLRSDGAFHHTAMKNIKTDGQPLDNDEDWLAANPLNTVEGCVLEMTWFGMGVMLFRVNDDLCRVIVTGKSLKPGESVLEVEKLHKTA